MNNTILSLDIAGGTNPKVMRLFDTSYFHKDLSVENYLIEVLPINKSTWVTFNVSKGFVLILNSSNLRYKKVSDESGLIDLLDGIYEIKQSYKPNILTVKHFYHMRVVDILNRINVEKSKLLAEKCNLSKAEYAINRDKLRDIEEYVYAAKWQVEEELDKDKGKELYQFADERLKSYTHECGCK